MSFTLLNQTLPLPWRSGRPLYRRRHNKITGIHSISSFLCRRNPRAPFFEAIVSRSGVTDVSWMLSPCDHQATDCDDEEYGGWAIFVDDDVQFAKNNIKMKKKTGFQVFLVWGIGASIALLVAGLSLFTLARRGFKFPFPRPLHALHNTWFPSSPEIDEQEVGDSDTSELNNVAPDTVEVEFPNTVGDNAKPGKLQPRVIPVAVDSTQLEALSALKALKIIEDDVKAGELCKRREYARWLVRANSLLERNQKHKINPSLALPGSVVPAFEDVNTVDPDFESIQALAEAGVVFNKISTNYSTKEHGRIHFYPDRFISRQDLIEWKAQLEYDFTSSGNVGIPESKLDLMDVKGISMEATPGLFVDMLARDKSLLRRVFGQTRRLQPDKPATKAQAAVALVSGRVNQAIHDELLRIEAEEASRQATKEEIKNELLDRGEIQRIWDEKMEREKVHGLRVQESYVAALAELESGKNVQEKALGEYWKEKSAIDCQKQLLNGLKKEVDEMSARLVSVGAELVAEEDAVRVISNDLQVKREGILDAKSILEAEVEAVRILRSWIEDEVRKNQARSKVLEEVERRWRWHE